MNEYQEAQNRIKDIERQIQSLESEKEELQEIKDPEKTSKLVNDFITRNGGDELLRKYSLQTEGIWEVRGEDPNADFGGHHHQPILGYYKGRLQDVIVEAVNLSGFWTWGSGGRIIKKSDDMITDLTKK